MSALPTPVALWWEASVRSSATMRSAKGREAPITAERPVTLGSILAPEMSLPISLSTKRSIFSKGMRGTRALASSRSSASSSSKCSPGTAVRLQVPWEASSRIARPKSTLPGASTAFAISQMLRAMWGKPCIWQMLAPYCLPQPMASILIRPLSCRPRKSVWGLTRPTGTIQSAAAAGAAMRTGRPWGVTPTCTVSIEETTGTPIASSVMP